MTQATIRPREHRTDLSNTRPHDRREAQSTRWATRRCTRCTASIRLDHPRRIHLDHGPSGSGKSTLFNMIGGLDKPTEGKVYIDEVDIAQLDAYELAWMRCRKIGYIFQTFNLIPVMTALENVMLPMIFAGMNDGRRAGQGAPRSSSASSWAIA